MTLTKLNTTGVTIFSGISTYFQALRSEFAETARRNRAYRKTRDQLCAMTERELDDIGITRFMIRDVALEAARLA